MKNAEAETNVKFKSKTYYKRRSSFVDLFWPGLVFNSKIVLKEKTKFSLKA
jgi:hypothetical protein